MSEHCGCEVEAEVEPSAMSETQPINILREACRYPALLKEHELFKKAEYDLSNAYIRLRKKLNAFDTPYAPSPEQIWTHTETKLDAILKAIRQLLCHVKDNHVEYFQVCRVGNCKDAWAILKETEQWVKL